MITIFFFNDTATTEIYTLSLHDALPISPVAVGATHVYHQYTIRVGDDRDGFAKALADEHGVGTGVYYPIPNQDRKSTRLNSSHANISYAVFCLKKKN